MILANRDLLATELCDLLAQLTGVRLERDEPSARTSPDASAHCSRVRIVGVSTLDVFLHCDPRLARQLTASMLGIPLDELAAPDTIDVVQEVTNVTAGWILRYLPDGLELSPPEPTSPRPTTVPLLTVSLVSCEASLPLLIAIHRQEHAA